MDPHTHEVEMKELGRPDERTTLLKQTHVIKSFNDDTVEANIGSDDILDQLPLITRTNSFTLPSSSLTEAVIVGVESEESEEEPQMYEELWKLLVLVYPVVLTYVLEYLPGLVCIVLVGHIDSPKTKEYVDAATLSTMFTNVTALAVGFGLASALDTLCSQAYGAGKLKKLGIYLQSGFIVIGACLIPIFLLNWHSGQFLVWLGQDPEVAKLAGEFSRFTVFGTPFVFLYEMVRKLLQAQNIVKPLVIFAIVSNTVNIVGGYYLTYHTSMGFYGAALARTVGYITLSFCLIPYFYWNPTYKLWWPGWRLREAVAHIRVFLHLGIPGMLMMAMEWWAYELLALMAGLLPDGVVAVSAHAVCMNVASSLYMVFLGISVAGNIRVGNCLGANKPRKAKMIARLTMSVVVITTCIVSALLFFFRFEIPKILINDPVSIQRAAETLLVLVPYENLDAINCVLQGIFRGAGRQHIAAKSNAIAFYVVGIPLAALLAFKGHLGVEGLWIGFGSGMATAFLVCLFILMRSSWEQMALEAQALSNARCGQQARLHPPTHIQIDAMAKQTQLEEVLAPRETTPLLPLRAGECEDAMLVSKEILLEEDPVAFREFVCLLDLMYPVVFTSMLEFLPGFTCVVLTGHLDSPDVKEYLDAATLSTMFANITSFSIGFGLSSALDTLCSQAYGAKRYGKIGIYFQSGLIVIGSCLVPIFFLNWYSGAILLALGQNERVAMLAQEFSRYLL
ncbi:TPA: hypothetical protein N0F65_001614 [Lagenidium giganteum]|uniref:Multidrug and toxin extrusion protein n=1 Tax=Lagenidium giganteum TaxID=4803 RepID=A0AAV2Z6J7_9STRA|nr:TPA: hypothetical protein N0F65_001614 [Lagenidium giganteum]